MSWKRLAPLLVAAAAVTGALHYLHDDARASIDTPPDSEPLVPVKIAQATLGNLDLSLQVVARAEAWSTVSVRARSSGQLQSLNFTPGAKVKRGTLLAQLDAVPFNAQLNQARGNVASAQAQFAKAQADFQRYSEVLAKGFVSRADYDSLQANVAVTRANLQTSEAAQELAQLQLSYTRILAPFDGVAGLPLIWPGAQVTANSTDIVVLNQVQPLRVSFSVPEADLAAIRAAQSHGPVPVQARLPGDDATPLQGQLDFIDNTVDPSTGTIVLKCRLENADGHITPGQFMQVSLPTAHLTGAVSMPPEALQTSDKGNFVFVIGADGKAHQRFVDVGSSAGGRVVVKNGLQAGERVVTDGQLLLSDGSAVRVANGT